MKHTLASSEDFKADKYWKWQKFGYHENRLYSINHNEYNFIYLHISI